MVKVAFDPAEDLMVMALFTVLLLTGAENEIRKPEVSGIPKYSNPLYSPFTRRLLKPKNSGIGGGLGLPPELDFLHEKDRSTIIPTINFFISWIKTTAGVFDRRQS